MNKIISNLEKERFKKEIITLLYYIEEQKIKLTISKEEFANEIITIIFNVIEKYADICSNIDIEELFQESYQYLLEVSLKDMSKLNGGFETYAKMQVKIKIEKLIIKNKIDLHLSSETNDLIRKCINTIIKLTNLLGRTPNIYEIADEINGEIEFKTEAKVKIDDIEKAIKVYNIYRDTINLGSINLETEDSYTTQDETQFALKQLITKILDEDIITEQEKCVLLLYYGIVPLNKSTLLYNNKTIILDGIPKTLSHIGTIFSLSHEKIRTILLEAQYKLLTSLNDLSVGLTDYALNPGLILKMKDISNWTKTIPFTDKYPDFYSFFKEYTKEEIFNVIEELADSKEIDIYYIDELEDFNEKVTGFCYRDKEKIKLLTTIQKIYIKLIEKYGRREMNITLNTCKYTYYGQMLDSLRNLYSDFSEYEEQVINYIVATANNYHRDILKIVFDSNLKRVLTPNEILKIEPHIIKSYYNVTRTFKANLEKLNIEDINTKELIVTNSNLCGIYHVFSSNSFDMIDTINTFVANLFDNELNLLTKVFGENLKDNNYNNNLQKLSKIELATYNCLMNRLKKLLDAKRKEQQTQEKYLKKKMAFYEFFTTYGYTFEEVAELLNSKKGTTLVEEYLTGGTSENKRTKIMHSILRMLYEKCGSNMQEKIYHNMLTKKI